MFAAVPSIFLLYVTKCLQDHERKKQGEIQEETPQISKPQEAKEAAQ